MMTLLEERAVVKYKTEASTHGTPPSRLVEPRPACAAETSAPTGAIVPVPFGGDAKATRNQPLTLREFVLWSVVPGLIPNAVVALMVGGAVKLG